MDTALLSPLDKRGKEQFEQVISAFQGDMSAAAAQLSIDPRLRLEYSRLIKAMSDELRERANIGILTWEQAAKEAMDARNMTMEMIRAKSTPVGRVLAQKMKLTGKTFNDLVARKTTQLYGGNANFNTLSDIQRNNVFGAIVESAGRSNPKVDLNMLRFSQAGKGLVVFSVAVAVYEVMNADDKLNETGRQLSISGAGIAGGWAGGAVAGLMCGPGAPVCVVLGCFVGGALAAWQMGNIWR
ncbi:hypothetical protein [Pectobacterium parmentieri]|uniref:Uncharacterized protein n=1 Tax=Pectobacterium parmentieri TaxID=1905730 RepID=A0A8B3FBK8_PECPM|nr:hypothetical protein [Pectobacterium parmentieri]AOR59407.1 hypothetical protein A8F97_10890 [Pectobacterium parmentieri]AYH09616.1 hypothetical protein C5E24_07900 [Pectobacterium parmentieri]AYH19675.1 hypothetical protein C5E22_14900 [Pectobacterium parmentieri]AYH35928.1 hypothetical protein C5E17_07770 [Pectobacterium parmentieri]AZS55997.1 hypothetical protein C5E18_07605 [Pectobacterium parmentieri]